jgi:lysophospholipid acyltransferase (LPLAT)-like uncharacterized protein
MDEWNKFQLHGVVVIKTGYIIHHLHRVAGFCLVAVNADFKKHFKEQDFDKHIITKPSYRLQLLDHLVKSLPFSNSPLEIAS